MELTWSKPLDYSANTMFTQTYTEPTQIYMEPTWINTEPTQIYTAPTLTYMDQHWSV